MSVRRRRRQGRSEGLVGHVVADVTLALGFLIRRVLLHEWCIVERVDVDVSNKC